MPFLEAEVELRAYWERTDAKGTVEDDNRTFHLQWAFSLLRLQCDAYSALNERDENLNSEGRVEEKFGKVHPRPPMNTLLDPAALYLTAILESMCVHILSSVGRVAACDSSRTTATLNDLFVVFCEDDSIYGLFRTMKVYEQIEQMSKTPLLTQAVVRLQLNAERFSEIPLFVHTLTAPCPENMTMILFSSVLSDSYVPLFPTRCRLLRL
ncbi:hypothetical protein BDZ97DRAFT_1255262 [Flammula alnicola]|nr:hypothetical protein BDZ97DRAFT_1255262 [Flammula alnicola]